MDIVYQLTDIQRLELIGQLYTDNSHFYPLQDINDNWVISEQEVIFCNNEEFSWVKSLSSIEYHPKVVEKL
jgi:hypothetical protein